MNDISITLKSFDVSTMSFSVPVIDIASPLTYDYGDPVTWAIDGKVLFHGTVSSCTRSMSGSDYKDEVEVECFWSKIRDTTYIREDGRTKCVFGTLDSCELASTIKELLKNMSFEVDCNTTSKYMPLLNQSFTLAQILRGLKASQPNLVSWWDYSRMQVDSNGIATGVQRLCFGTARDAKTYTLGRDNLTSLKVGQSKQKSNGVRFIYRWIDKNGNTRIIDETSRNIETYESVTTIETSPEATGTPTPAQNRQSQLRASTQTMTIKGIPVPSDSNQGISKKFWDVADGRFADAPITYGKVKISPLAWSAAGGAEEPENHKREAHGYMLVEGAIHPKAKGFRWCKAVISQAIIPDGKIENQDLHSVFNLRRAADGKRYAWLTSTVTLISVPHRTYIIGGNYEYIPGDSEPPPDPEPDPDPATPFAQIANQIDDGILAMGWSGSLTIVGDRAREALEMLGSNINIIGGDKRWETMLAPCQSMSYQAIGKHGDIPDLEMTTINFGVADHNEWGDQIQNQEPGRAAEAAEQSASSPNGWSYEFNKDDGEPIAQPGITAGAQTQSSVLNVGNPSFQVRYSQSDDGKPEMTISKGKVHCKSFVSAEVGTTEWRRLPDDWETIWLVASINIAEKKITAEIQGKKPETAESKLTRHVHIATITDDGDIIQHHIGDYQMPPPPAECPDQISSSSPDASKQILGSIDSIDMKIIPANSSEQESQRIVDGKIIVVLRAPDPDISANVPY